MCRDRFGTFSVGVFHVWTCSLCYNYLFPHSSHPQPSSSSSSPSSTLLMGIASPTGEEVYPDVSNTTSLTTICSWLEEGQCTRWLQCCHAAASCCRRQITNMLRPVGLYNETSTRLGNGSNVMVAEGVTGSVFEGAGKAGGGGFCPQTWDGFSCLDETPAGTQASVICPAYLEQTQSSGWIFLLFIVILTSSFPSFLYSDGSGGRKCKKKKKKNQTPSH